MHNIPIVGGYWGFANSRDRQLSKHLFKILTNKFIAEYFNPGDKNLKGHDQFLLTEFFSPYSLKNSTTHDAFLCDKINGDPWPTKRSIFYVIFNSMILKALFYIFCFKSVYILFRWVLILL